MRENTIEEYLVERVKAMGGEVRKVKWIGRHGAPDRLVMLPTQAFIKWDGKTLRPGQVCYAEDSTRHGRAIWVGLKAPGEKAKPHQVREHERMRHMGQRVEIVDSFDGVDEVLA